jgi:hypothetical protein
MSGLLARLLASAAAQPPRPVHVHIGCVVIDGIQMTAAQGRQFSAALALEFQRLAREPGWPADAAGVRVPGVVAPSVSAAAGVAPGALGRDVARSVFDAVRGTR